MGSRVAGEIIVVRADADQFSEPGVIGVVYDCGPESSDCVASGERV